MFALGFLTRNVYCGYNSYKNSFQIIVNGEYTMKPIKQWRQVNSGKKNNH